MSVELENILDNFDLIKDEIENLSRSKKSELILNMKERELSKLEPEQIENLIKFLVTLSDDQIIVYLLYLMDMEYEFYEADINVQKFLADQRFLKYRDLIMKEVEDNSRDRSRKITKSVPRKLRKKAKKLREKIKKNTKKLIKLYK